MIAGRKDNCQNPLGQSDEVPSMTDSSFGIEQKAAAPFAETSQLIAPPADDAGRRFSPLDRLAQVGAAGKAIELLRPERERVRLGGLETDQEADRRGCGVVGCAIGSAEPHTHHGGVRVLPISWLMRPERYAGELHAHRRIATQPRQQCRGIQPRGPDLLKGDIGSPPHR